LRPYVGKGATNSFAAVEVVLLLGGNVGDVARTFAVAEGLLEARAGQILARSRDHWTEPWGFADDRLFLNRALLVRSDLPLRELLVRCLHIEEELGRVRTGAAGYAPRTIDIDILLADAIAVDEPGLTVPHPRMHERYFALAPAADIVPLQVVPTLDRTVLQLLNDVKQRL
jgi:2-amino-4-hydroxy-6-hydroxymethyldihydropteridine diphosphokinase